VSIGRKNQRRGEDDDDKEERAASDIKPHIPKDKTKKEVE
jgi:hypothetical protein